MVRRITSPEVVGRAEELSVIRAATKAAAGGDGAIVLVSGDAGMGKTRLIETACAQAAADGYGAVVGGCVQLGEVPLAYAPVVEILRQVREELGEDGFASFASPALMTLVDGEPAAGSGRLFTSLVDFLTRIGRLRPWLIVFEDLHWADASTRDLLAFLGRNLRRTRVTLVLTYRADELHRRHPLRPLVADLERLPDTERIALPGLGRADLVDLLIRLGRDDVDLATVSALQTRTGGNPLYIEELVAATRDAVAVRTALPATLAEVMLARAGEISTAAQSILRRAAVLGSEIDDRLLAAICDPPLELIVEALREAVLAQLLVLDGGRCRFRHALLAEALYEDLLPDERQRIHLAAAQALEKGEHAELAEHARWALLAHHWNAARDMPRAFAAAMRAGAEQVRVRADAAAVGHLERALELWDQVPDAAAIAGIDRAELLLRAAQAVHNSSRSPRQLTLVNAAYEALGEATEPERRAAVLEQVAHMHWELDREREGTAAYELAATLLADRPASAQRAFALAALGRSLMFRDQYSDAEATLLDAIGSADATETHEAGADARCTLGLVQAELGRTDEGVATLHNALRLSTTHEYPGVVSRCYNNLAASLLRAGRYDEVVRTAAEGLEYCAQAGRLGVNGNALTAMSVAALTNLGRWGDATRVEAALSERMPDPRQGWYADYLAAWRLLRQLWAGEHEVAGPEITRLLRATADTTTAWMRGMVLFRSGELAWRQRRWEDARSALAEGLRVCESGDGQYYVAYGLALALGVEADRVEAVAGSGPHVDAEIARAQAVADQLAGRVAALRSRVGDSLSALLPEPAAWLAVADAEHARTRRADTVDQWLAVAAGWDTLDMPYPAAAARWRAAEAGLRAGGGRGTAAEYAAEALRVAESLGAAPLATQIRLLAQRGRLDLEPANAPPPQREPDMLARLGITRREAEVLELLAAGRTNRQIAESLYISEKTASVHVTNLLRKLGVSNRIDAAAIAQRLDHDGG